MAKSNRKYKDGVFTGLFYLDRDAEKNLLSLYNALHGTDYPDPAVVEKCRLEDAIFMNFKNDVAALMNRSRLFLSEQQSTVNENLPVRMLLYVAREYEKLIPERDRYRRKVVRIPTPEFVVIYNGREEFPREKTLRLSDAYMDAPEVPELDLSVRVININPGYRHELLGKCRVLYEYSEFVETTRRYGNDSHALEQAVKECRAKGILEDYLTRNGSEVINMLLAEYSYEEDLAVNREEAREEGREEGRAEGRAEGERRMGLLMERLYGEGRADDVKLALRDGRVRERLYAEYGI